MGEQLDLTSPQTFPDLTNWAIQDLYLDRVTPSIKITVASNTGTRLVLRYVPDPEDPSVETMISAGLKFINDGKFQTIAGQTLQRWLLEKLSADGKLPPGTVSGTPD